MTAVFRASCRWCWRRIEWNDTHQRWLRVAPAPIDGDILRGKTVCALSPAGTTHSPDPERRAGR